MISVLQTHLTFGKEFTEAVEMKQVAQQEAERARFIVEKVRYPSEELSLGNSSWYLFANPACSEHPPVQGTGQVNERCQRVIMLIQLSALAHHCWIGKA